MCSRRFRYAFLLLLIAVSLRSAQIRAAEKFCALLADGHDRSVSALAAHVQAKAGEIANTKWVERAEIERVLTEQKLATALAPENARERIALGKLLKADVLIMLRPVAAKRDPAIATPRGLHVVVAETRGGLRLMSQIIPADALHQAAAADAILDLAKSGIEKAREEVKQVCAVPPFASSDLTYEFGYLKEAYPSLIEQALLERPGLVVVELAEARAIANEMKLADGNIARPLPIYVLGDYRNAGAGDARRQSLHITIQRGEKQLEELTKKDLTPREAAEFVRATATRVIQVMNGAADKTDPAAAADPKIEVQQLADRAALHRKIGDWPEAAALTEAALLLAPDDIELHRQAVIAYTRITYAAAPNMGERKAENVHRRAAPYFRALEHLETFLSTAGKLEQYNVPRGSNFVWDLLHAPGGWTESGHDYEKPKAWHAALAECIARDREMRLRIAHMRARGNYEDATQYVIGALWDLPEPEQYRMIREFLDATKDLPGTRNRATRLAPHGHVNTILDSDEGRKLLAWMKNSGNRELIAAEASLQKMIDSDKSRETARVEEETKRFITPTTVPDGPAEIVFKPIQFNIDGQGRAVESVSGLIPAGKGIDFAWIGSTCYVMKQKGVLRQIWTTAEMNVWIKSVSFDGRYVWLTAQRWKNRPLVMVFDPVTEKSWEVKPEDGLPLDAKPADERTIYMVRAVGVSPGLACIAGSFGRTWIAMVTFSPATGPLGQVFHEATEAPNNEDKEQWRQKTLAFLPTFMATLFDPKGKPDQTSEKRVLIGRAEAQYGSQYKPLVVNPATRSVDVLQDDGPWVNDTVKHWTIHEGALYWAWPTRRTSSDNARPNIYRIALPDLRRTTVAEHVYDAEAAIWNDILVFYEGRVHLLARQWWSAEAVDQPFRALRGDVPMRLRIPPPGHTVSELPNRETERVDDLLDSNHYGLLAQVHRNTPPSSTCQVIFPKP